MPRSVWITIVMTFAGLIAGALIGFGLSKALSLDLLQCIIAGGFIGAIFTGGITACFALKQGCDTCCDPLASIKEKLSGLFNASSEGLVDIASAYQAGTDCAEERQRLIQGRDMYIDSAERHVTLIGQMRAEQEKTLKDEQETLAEQQEKMLNGDQPTWAQQIEDDESLEQQTNECVVEVKAFCEQVVQGIHQGPAAQEPIVPVAAAQDIPQLLRESERRREQHQARNVSMRAKWPGLFTPSGSSSQSPSGDPHTANPGLK